ncbi:flagellar hook-length control protein FliK [Campylobacter sp. MIT 12-8780]|uniref:flagellar hook-length control protein FliK n=1 Tax=Campylobacter sp. MIT 12-8780 TaxID=2202200 RepID=UPI00115D6FD2|nr:flagellar hook-length control protein FliK [Campylobacter sp. MIT 12-8780]TQR40345.1 flagellar hook-length control protein FliK [Campylobacter sp. MIT 12-8780]
MLAAKSDIIDLAFKQVKTSASEPASSSSSVSSDEGQSFLANLVQAIDETNQFLPERLQISEQEVLQDARAMLEKSDLLGGFGSFDESKNESIFESLSFMEVLGVLEKLQIQSTDIKLGNLSSQTQQLLSTQSNLEALKGAKNLGELLELAKGLNLNVSNIKVDRLLELKEAFPNLNKAEFFNKSIENVFKQYLNTKIAAALEGLESKQNTQKSNSKDATNLLSKALKSLDLENKNKKTLVSENTDELTHTKATKIDTSSPSKEPKDKIIDHLDSKIENTKENISEKTAKNSTLNTQKDEFKSTLQVLSSKEAINDKLNNTAKNSSNASLQTPSTEKSIKENTFILQDEPNTKVSSKSFNQTQEIKETKSQTQDLTKEVSKEGQNTQILNSKLVKEKEKIQTQIQNEDEKATQNQALKTQNAEPKNAEKIITKNDFDVKDELETIHNQNTKELPKEFAKEKSTPKSEIKANSNEQVKLASEIKTMSESVRVENKDFKSTDVKPAFENILNKINTKENLGSNAQNNANSEQNQNASKEQQNLNFGKESTQKSSEESTLNINKNDNSELNSLIKDLAQVSRNELKSAVNAKETLQHFANDLKEQMANYKAPITKLNITLNPSNLGEVEVTLIQRGSNLHINFNTNTNAMNLFIQNQAEFKNSLVNMGFTGLEMNFSDQSKKEQNQGQNKNKNAFNYESEFENTSENNTLELVLARYF